MNDVLLPLRESVQYSWRAKWQEEGVEWKKESKQEEKSKRKKDGI